MNTFSVKCAFWGVTPFLISINYFGWHLYGDLSLGVFLVSLLVTIIPVFFLSELGPLRTIRTELREGSDSFRIGGFKDYFISFASGTGASVIALLIGYRLGGLAFLISSVVGVFVVAISVRKK